MKYLTLAIILSCLLLASCTQQQPAVPAPSAPQAPVKAAVATEAPVSTPTPATTSVATSSDPEIQRLIAKSASIQSYEYLDDTTKNFYFVKDNKIRIDLKEWAGSPQEPYDTIYLDLDREQAFATCAGRAVRCNKAAKTYKVVTFSDYQPTTPLQYLNDIKDGKVVESQKCEQKVCLAVEYTQNGDSYKMYVMDYNGMPYEIRKAGSEGSYTRVALFSDQAYDHLKNADVNVPEGYTLVK